MKFAKELEEELVPEWRAKYLNYKGGKKKVKAIARALKHVEQTPWTPARRPRGTIPTENWTTIPGERSRPRHFGVYRSPTATQHDDFRSHVNAPHANAVGGPSSLPAPSNLPVSPLLPDPQAGPARERQPLKSATNPPGPDRSGSYGSITRPSSPGLSLGQPFPTLDLPGPALDPNTAAYPSSIENGQTKDVTAHPAHPQIPPNATRKNSRHGILPGSNNIFRPRINSASGTPGESKRPILQRLFSTRTGREYFINHHVDPEAFVEVRIREAEFFTFLDKELVKIETFYRMKEEEASDRLIKLKSQLHLMHDSHTAELRHKNQRRDAGKKFAETVTSTVEKRRTFGSSFMGKSGHSKDPSKGSIQREASGPVPCLTVGELSKDYAQRRPVPNVPYNSAKKKLKLALLEFYRGLELLKAYADLNRTAFRKMNKKYDKVTHARPTGRYMSEKVNKAWFVQSEVIENHLVAVEDLYTRYFEKGNRKAAIGKLRGKVYRPQDHSPSAYRNGLTCGAGLVLGIQGLVYAVEHLHGDDDTIRAQTGYLLQVYGGYFLILLHFLLFCLDCMVWSGSKINYVFVFEFDTRHVLDWRQLAEIPCFFVFLEGLFIWLNFRWINSMFIYFPLILIAATVAIMFFPFRTLYHRSRAWWAYSNWRLLFAGFYPVEFRDFFLGDMYCSQTYAMGNIALFFCLYSNSWEEPAQCNSSHSRAMGFLTALPAIWRAFQCLRRYRDTRDAFPHIVNFSKYAFSILYAMTLSLYRIGKSHHYRAAFIVCACINAMYTSIWDLAMDWSLGNPHAKYPFLRDFLAFRRRWVYYAAMIIDPLLRFSWILYVIFQGDVQHSALLSFVVALLEVGRRGMWSIFRVENEHCTNVCRFRASRDLPLPYDLSSTFPSASALPDGDHVPASGVMPPRTTGVDIERIATSQSLRHRGTPQFSDTGGGTLSRVSNLLANAHAQDFERRKNREGSGTGRTPESHPRRGRDSSTEDEAEEEDEDAEEPIPNLVDDPLYPGNANLFDEDQGHPHRT